MTTIFIASPGDIAEAAWAAGFFDGEGGTYAQTSNGTTHGRLVAQVSQAERGPLERFYAAVDGVGKIYGPYKNGKGGKGVVFAYRVHGLSGIQVVLTKLWPYLGETKRAQARDAVIKWALAGNGERLRSYA